MPRTPRRNLLGLKDFLLNKRLLWLLVLTFALGCQKPVGTDTVHLWGKVTIDGKNLPSDADGNILFMTTGVGQAPPSSVDIQGSTYDAESVPKGNVNVIFNITRLTGRMVREDNAPVPDEIARCILKADVYASNDIPRPAWASHTKKQVITTRSHHSGGVNASRCDGSVQFAANDIDVHLWRAMTSASGEETDL
ncbi:MAG: DUF1559 domain-containing protein [Pirellulales bacterium]|nr:DUF1559 domain-containing protein [Pirellulales bacterium]